MPDAAADLPRGMTVRAWAANDAAPRELDDWRRAGQPGQGIIWIDLERPTDLDAIAEAIDAMGLPGYDRAMLGHVLSQLGPDDYGGDEVPWYDAAVAGRLNQLGQPQ